jgi:PadR family transcriptional regulator PadR
MDKKNDSRIELLQGTLDLMILRTLLFGPSHGHAIAKYIRTASEDALHRLEARGWIEADWRISDKGKRARFYRLTRTGRKQLHAEQSKWDELSAAIARVLRPA